MGVPLAPFRLGRDRQFVYRRHLAGWGIYAWHGVRVPKQVILAPEQLSREDFLNEPNVEVRRVIQERMGERFVSELGGVMLDRSPGGPSTRFACPKMTRSG